MLYRAKDLPMRFSCPGAPRYGEMPPALPPELAYHGWRGEAFNVPTEVVVTEARIVTPTQGRAWEVDLQLYCGLYISSEKLVTRPMYDASTQFDASVPYGDPGYNKHAHAFVAELWEDHGDDGHVSFQLSGFVLAASFKEALDEATRPWRRGWRLGS